MNSPKDKAMALQQKVAEHATAIARDQPQHRNAYDIELPIARNERARKHAGDNRQIVDECRNYAAARRDKRKYMLGDEIHDSPLGRSKDQRP